MAFDRLETLIVAILAFFLGRWVTRHVRWLRRSSVPEAVTGGFLVIPATGKDDDAAVMSSGYFGLGLGAKPIAVANVNAITQRLGPSPRALLAVPRIGLAFFDVIHVFVVKVMLQLLG